MNKRFALVVMVVFLLLHVMIFADGEKEQKKINTWAYFQT